MSNTPNLPGCRNGGAPATFFISDKRYPPGAPTQYWIVNTVEKPAVSVSASLYTWGEKFRSLTRSSTDNGAREAVCVGAGEDRAHIFGTQTFPDTYKECSRSVSRLRGYRPSLGEQRAHHHIHRQLGQNKENHPRKKSLYNDFPQYEKAVDRDVIPYLFFLKMTEC